MAGRIQTRTLPEFALGQASDVPWNLSADQEGPDCCKPHGWLVVVRADYTADPYGYLDLTWGPETDPFQGLSKASKVVLLNGTFRFFVPADVVSLRFYGPGGGAATAAKVAAAARRVALADAPQDARWLWSVSDLGNVAAAASGTATAPAGAVGYRLAIAKSGVGATGQVDELAAGAIVASYQTDGVLSQPAQEIRQWKPLFPLASVTDRQVKWTNGAGGPVKCQIEWVVDLWGPGVLR